MAPQHQIRIAHALMVLGIAPWVLDLVWVEAILLSSRAGQGPQVFMLDPIAMIGVLITTFAIGVTVAGLSMLWSMSLTASNPELRSRKIIIARVAVVAVLIVPLLLSSA